MDMQTAVISHLHDYSQIIEQVSKAIGFARVRDIPVIYVMVDFRPGMPEVGENNKIFSASKARLSGLSNLPAMDIDPSLRPDTGDIIVTKKRVSAFTGSDLELVLRANGISHLMLSGVATSGVVLSTLREAADKDFEITVLSDCCTDMDRQLHDVLIKSVFPTQASVSTLSDLENMDWKT